MSKIEKGILMGSYRKLLKSNREVSGIRDLFSSYVSDILGPGEKGSFGQEDFELFKGHFESLKPYHKVLKDRGINCSIEMTELFVLGQSVDEFKYFLGNDQIEDLIGYGNIENIRLFFGKDGIIKTKADLESLFKNGNIDKVLYLIGYGNIENIRLFFGEDGIIKTREDLDGLLRSSNIDKIIDITKYGNIVNIRLFFGEDFYDIKTREDLDGLFRNSNIDKIINIITSGKPERIQILFGNTGIIKTIEDLESLLDRESLSKILYLINNGRFESKILSILKSNDIEDIIQSSLSSLGLRGVPNEERKGNIDKVNKSQIDFLDNNYVSGEKVDYSNFDNKKRTLVLYCREYQISPEDFFILLSTVKKFVIGGYSRIFSDLSIVSRESWKNHRGIIRGIMDSSVEYKDVNGKGFEKTCSIFANTIHFSHGRPIENLYGSIPILSASVRGDREKMSGVNKFIPLRLKLDNRGYIQVPIGETLYDDNISLMVTEMLRAIIKLEDLMLSEID